MNQQHETNTLAGLCDIPVDRFSIYWNVSPISGTPELCAILETEGQIYKQTVGGIGRVSEKELLEHLMKRLARDLAERLTVEGREKARRRNANVMKIIGERV